MKYSEIKNLSVSEFLLLMQQSVKSNTESIKGNNAAIDSIINKEVKSKSRDEKLDQLFKQNRALTEESSSIIELHNKVISFMKSEHKKDNSEYSKVVNEINNTVKEAKSVDRNKLFDDTINGLVSFNMQHPLYSDNEFKTMLIEYYISTEEYEMCERLMNL